MTSSIKRLIAAQVVRTLNFSGPIFTLFLVAKGLSLQQVLSLVSIVLFSGMFFEIPTGVFGDRCGRKWSMVAGAATSVIGWFVWLHVNTFIGFGAVYVLFGLANAFWSGSDQAFIIDELKAAGKESQTQKVFAAYGALMTGAYGVAALASGMIAPLHTMENFHLLFQLTLAASIVGLLVTLSLKESRHTTTEVASEKTIAQFGSGIRLLRANKKLRKIVLYFLFTTSFGFVLMELYQIYFVHAHVPENWFGPALAISAGCVALVKWYSYKIEEWFGVERGLLVTSIVPIILFIAIGFVVNPIVAVLLFIMTDAANNVRDPIIIDYQNRHIHGAHRATVLSTISLIMSAFVVAMNPILGAIADHNFSAAFFATAGAVAFGVVFFRLTKEDVTV